MQPPSTDFSQSESSEESSNSSDGTPPPTQQELKQNTSRRPLLTAPSFAQFALQSPLSVAPGLLQPKKAILPTEIQEISAEEFGQSIEAATQSAEEILALKLPRSCKWVAEKLALSITACKRKWEADGALPDEEDIKITHLATISSKTSKHLAPRKLRTRKRPKKPSGQKPVDLLNKPASSSNKTLGEGQSKPPAPGPTAGSQATDSTTALSRNRLDAPTGPQADTGTTRQFESWSSPPADPSSADCARSGPSNHAAPTDLMPTDPSLPPPTDSHCSNVHTAHGGEDSDGPNETPLFNPETPDQSTPPPDPGQTTSSMANPTPSDTRGPNPIPSSPLLTIIKSNTIRREVVSIHQHVDGTKPNWSKYQTTWTSLTSLLQHCARAAQNSPPGPPTFDFHRTSCSYAAWMHTITSLADRFLSHSDHEQWYCPDLVDFQLLTSFANKDNKLRPGTFIPTGAKTQHPESTLVWFLFRLLNPPQHVHTKWARLIAASVELMADNILKPAQVDSTCETDHINRGVETLSYLDAMKNSTSSFDPPPQANESSSQPPERFHSVDVLHEFRKIILDVLMAYIIFQTHHLSDAPMTEAKKKAKTRANRAPSANSSVCQVEKNPAELANTFEEASQNLQRYQRKQNFQPLVYFVLGGVRGLFITLRDHRTAGVSGCMSMIQAMAIITANSKIPHPPDKPIWKNLLAYLVRIFSPVFQSSGQICSLASVQVPTRMELAQAITNDFLNHWKTFNPTSSFLLPHTSGEIEEC
ncbi:hypothetical protein PtB15_2B53 [Puccinia triticina]|nr:hypothetical protein PtB15_2B53 [Puccinia triticina]